jgi:hypothetical protein
MVRLILRGPFGTVPSNPREVSPRNETLVNGRLSRLTWRVDTHKAESLRGLTLRPWQTTLPTCPSGARGRLPRGKRGQPEPGPPPPRLTRGDTKRETAAGGRPRKPRPATRVGLGKAPTAALHCAFGSGKISHPPPPHPPIAWGGHLLPTAELKNLDPHRFEIASQTASLTFPVNRPAWRAEIVIP